MGKIVVHERDAANPPPLTPAQKAELERLEAMPDSEIDYSDIPELDEEWFAKARANKERLTVRFDREVVDWFRSQGRGYQTRMNAVLKAFVEQQTRRSE